MHEEGIVVARLNRRLEVRVLRWLTGAKYKVATLPGNDGLLGFVGAARPQLVVLGADLGRCDSPDMELCRRLRSQHGPNELGILVLARRLPLGHECTAHTCGADACLHTERLTADVLLLNVREILQGVAAYMQPSITCGRMTLSVAGRTVSIEDRQTALTEAQFHILWRLAEYPDAVLSPRELLGESHALTDKAVAALAQKHIYRLRKALGKDGAIIECVRGLGYRLNLRYVGAI